MTEQKLNFGDMVIKAGYATSKQVEECIDEQRRLKANGRVVQLGAIMIEKGYLNQDQVRSVLEKQDVHILICDGCSGRYNVNSYKSGQKVRCKKCGTVLVVPDSMADVSVDDQINFAEGKGHTGRVVADIILFEGKKPREAIPVEENEAVTIGRAQDNRISVNDNMVSRYHCRLENDGVSFVLIDMKSRNGTQVNTEPIKRQKLKNDDHIQLGGVNMIFRIRPEIQFVSESMSKAKDVGGADALLCGVCGQFIPPSDAQKAKRETMPDGKELFTCVMCLRKHDPLIGRIIGGCKVVDRIDESLLDNVYSAHQLSMDRKVILKIMHKELGSDEEKIKQFLREAKVGAKLSHQNIVQLFDMGNEDGFYFIILEHIEGRRISDLMREHGALDWKFVLEVAIQIVDALLTASHHDIVHRDINPDNIYVNSENIAKLANLSLAKPFEDGADGGGITSKNLFISSPAYMSPEQIRNPHNIDGRSDIYSLGATLYHMLVGRALYSGNSPVEIVRKILHEQPLPLSQINSSLPLPLSQVVGRMVAKNPADRYQTPAELLNDLQKVQGIV